jgi:hypothetical protein
LPFFAQKSGSDSVSKIVFRRNLQFIDENISSFRVAKVLLKNDRTELDQMAPIRPAEFIAPSNGGEAVGNSSSSRS